jgi:hypothetical protein
MPHRTALLATMLLASCSGGAPVPDDPPRLASPSAAIPPAAVSATLVFPAAASVGAAVASASPYPLGSTTVHPIMHDDTPTLSNAGLPPEVVRRIVRQNFGRLRLCYEVAARKDPTLSGTVVIRYVIDTSGAVSAAADVGSTIGSPDLVACVTRAFLSLAFPSPTAGSLVVTQAIYFTPRSP